MTTSNCPLVSIRIPAYNHEKYIHACLNSVLSEDYPNKELVIINDGSTDGTDHQIRGWIDQHGDELPVKYVSRENRGLTKTLNELIAMCHGDYLVSLASDDLLENGGIKARVEYLEKHGEKDAVIGDCMVIDGAGLIVFKSALTGLYAANTEKYATDDGIQEEVIWNWSIPGPVLMVRRGIYKKIGLYDIGAVVEDWDLYLRMVSMGLLGFIPSIVASYRLHEGNVSRDGNEAYVRRALLRAGIRNIARFKGKSRLLLLKKIAVYLWQMVIGRIR